MTLTPLERAHRTRTLVEELAEAVEVLGDDPTHFAVRIAVSGLLDRLGVVEVTRSFDGRATWRFEDGVVEEAPDGPERARFLPLDVDPRVRDCSAAIVRILKDEPAAAATVVRDLAARLGLDAVSRAGDTSFEDRVDAGASAFGAAIFAADPEDDEQVVALRLAFRGLLDQARVEVPEAWEAAVLHELGAVIRSGLRRGRARVTQGVVDVLVEHGALTATLTPDSRAELMRLWADAEVEGWFAPGPPRHASSGRRAP